MKKSELHDIIESRDADVRYWRESAEFWRKYSELVARGRALDIAFTVGAVCLAVAMIALIVADWSTR